MNVWQIAAGERGRNYSSLCLKHDLALIGPGDPGPYPKSEIHYKNKSQVKNFCREPKPGDLVLLRLYHDVVGVGLIPEGEDNQYRWCEDFDDVLGWDLQHTRRVLWDPEAIAILQDMQPVFGNHKQQPTFTAVRESRILERAPHLKGSVKPRALKELPTVERALPDEALGIQLFAAGLANESIEDVIAVLRKIRRLASWYEQGACGVKRPNEHEIVAHAVVPLMLGLGWSEQLLAVEWNRVDVAFFDRPPTNEENCIAVLEAKRLGSPIEDTYKQAENYVKSLNLSRCKVIITTDGMRIFVYHRQADGWPDHPTGYANFAKMRIRHAIPENTSA
ncbi:MAG: hypothetical protein IMZ66_08715, partial [Planctomycetes bacterium]|nr:hypothetical protein [Planctomycetota bacterium]